MFREITNTRFCQPPTHRMFPLFQAVVKYETGKHLWCRHLLPKQISSRNYTCGHPRAGFLEKPLAREHHRLLGSLCQPDTAAPKTLPLSSQCKPPANFPQ